MVYGSGSSLKKEQIMLLRIGIVFLNIYVHTEQEQVLLLCCVLFADSLYLKALQCLS